MARRRDILLNPPPSDDSDGPGIADTGVDLDDDSPAPLPPSVPPQPQSRPPAPSILARLGAMIQGRQMPQQQAPPDITPGGWTEKPPQGVATITPDGRMVAQPAPSPQPNQGGGGWGNVLMGALHGAVAGGATPNIAGGGATDVFRAMQGANNDFAARKKAQEDKQQQAVENAQKMGTINHQNSMDDRLMEIANEKARHDKAAEGQKGTDSDARSANNDDKVWVNATKDGRWTGVDPDLAAYLDGKPKAGYAVPDGFNRSLYDQVGGRWAQRNDLTNKEKNAQVTTGVKAAAAGFEADPNTGAVTPRDANGISLPQASVINKNDAAATALGNKSPDAVQAQRIKEADQFGLTGRDKAAYVLTGKFLEYPPASVTNPNNSGEKRLDHSYEFHSKRLDKISDPVSQASDRMGKLQEALSQGTPQADALVAPELLSIMAGGQGSGLRMNESEIARIVGGRSGWENLKAQVQHWALNPNEARTITPDQHNQIWALTKAVGDKLAKKRQILDDARDGVINASSPDEHRRILAKAQHDLGAVDNPNGVPAAQAPKSTGPAVDKNARVTVKDKKGNKFTVPQTQLQQAISQGYEQAQ